MIKGGLLGIPKYLYSKLKYYNEVEESYTQRKESLDGEEWIVLAREENGEPKLINKTAISNESAELKLVLSSGKLEGHFRSMGGDTWQVVDCCKLIEKSNPQIGLFTHGCPSEIERWVVFKNFTVTKDS